MSLPQTAKIVVPVQWIVPGVCDEPVPVIDLGALIEHARKEDNLLTTAELAERMNLGVGAVADLIRLKRIRPLLSGSKHLFHYPTVIEQLKETAK